ncbi:hypothetical protein GCM10027199_85060 [Amycolatopsis magusensis]
MLSRDWTYNTMRVWRRAFGRRWCWFGWTVIGGLRLSSGTGPTILSRFSGPDRGSDRKVTFPAGEPPGKSLLHHSTGRAG